MGTHLCALLGHLELFVEILDVISVDESVGQVAYLRMVCQFNFGLEVLKAHL